MSAAVKSEIDILEMDSEADHFHVLVAYQPKLAVSGLVNSLKGVSSRLLRRDRPDIAARYYYKGVLWSRSYFACSVGGAAIETLKAYAESQPPGLAPLYPRLIRREFTGK